MPLNIFNFRRKKFNIFLLFLVGLFYFIWKFPSQSQIPSEIFSEKKAVYPNTLNKNDVVNDENVVVYSYEDRRRKIKLVHNQDVVKEADQNDNKMENNPQKLNNEEDIDRKSEKFEKNISSQVKELELYNEVPWSLSLSASTDNTLSVFLKGKLLQRFRKCLFYIARFSINGELEDFWVSNEIPRFHTVSSFLNLTNGTVHEKQRFVYAFSIFGPSLQKIAISDRLRLSELGSTRINAAVEIGRLWSFIGQSHLSGSSPYEALVESLPNINVTLGLKKIDAQDIDRHEIIDKKITKKRAVVEVGGNAEVDSGAAVQNDEDEIEDDELLKRDHDNEDDEHPGEENNEEKNKEKNEEKNEEKSEPDNEIQKELADVKKTIESTLDTILPLDETKLLKSSFEHLCNGITAKKNSHFCLRGVEAIKKSQTDQFSLSYHPLVEQQMSILKDVPIIIIAGNRSSYLNRCLYHLVRLPGLNRSNVVVHVDGFYEDTFAVTQVYGVRMVSHAKAESNSKKNKYFKAADKIAVHYKRAFKSTFAGTSVSNAIILEEDLQVAPDFLTYFSQTLPLLEKDTSLFCVSAWNDNAYNHTSSDPTKLYRTEFFPGLGWLLSRRLWDEIRPRWPKCCRGFSWDLWLRHKKNRKGRECLMPEVPRTFHFGRSGANVNNLYYYVMYFMNHKLNTQSNVELDISNAHPAYYEKELAHSYRSSIHLNITEDICKLHSDGYVPDTTGKIYSIWYYQNDGKSDWTHLTRILKCWNMWDLGAPRGLHQGLLRFNVKGNHILLAGSMTNYAKIYKPETVMAARTGKQVARKVDNKDIALAKMIERQYG